MKNNLLILIMLVFSWQLTGQNIEYNCIEHLPSINSLMKKKGYPQNFSEARKLELSQALSSSFQNQNAILTNTNPIGIRIRIVYATEALIALGGVNQGSIIAQRIVDSLSQRYKQPGMDWLPNQFILDGWEDHAQIILIPEIQGNTADDNIVEATDWAMTTLPVGLGTSDVVIFIRNGSFLGGTPTALTFSGTLNNPQINHNFVERRGYIMVVSGAISMLMNGTNNSKKTATAVFAHEIGHDLAAYNIPTQPHHTLSGYVMSGSVNPSSVWDIQSQGQAQACATYMNNQPSIQGYPRIATVAVPLPIQLLSFSATQQSNSNILTWQTATETNNDYFQIERSLDGKAFEHIGTVQGQGNSYQKNQYSYSDDSPFSTTYYRLVSVDFDKTEHISKIIVIDKDRTDDWIKVATKTNETLSIQLFDDKEGEIQVEIYDLTGKLMLKTDLDGDILTQNINISEFFSGIYIVKAYSENRMFSQRIVKL